MSWDISFLFWLHDIVNFLIENMVKNKQVMVFPKVLQLYTFTCFGSYWNN